jgi:DNA-binding MarR family transcriptional regulator
MTSRWLDADEDRAWRSYRRMFTLLEATLAQELVEGTGLSMADYTVLSNLVEADGRRWRLTDLADHMRWSQSRLSHQIRRMEERGLVRREPSPDDARSSHAVLTRDGLQAIAGAAPIHFAGVRQHMIDLLTLDQLKTLEEIADTVVTQLSGHSSQRGAMPVRAEPANRQQGARPRTRRPARD